MALPSFLVVEMRAAFRSCARQYSSTNHRQFSAYRACQKQTPPRRNDSSQQRSWPYNGAVVPQSPPQPRKAQAAGTDSDSLRNIVPHRKERGELDTERRVPVPMKIIPKADITPNLRLSPRQRLHVEVLTRQNPRAPEKKIYRERLQIYHMGSLRENVLAATKVGTIACACVVTFIIAPAHLNAGSEPWLVAFIWACGFVPFFAINYFTKPMVSRVFLSLPPNARETSKQAMDYAKNLPPEADVDIEYLKPWGLPSIIKANVCEFEPSQGTWLRPVSFRFLDKYLKKRPTPRFSPTSFYVEPKTASGEASRDTIPGIWGSVYKRLMESPQDNQLAKWSK